MTRVDGRPGREEILTHLRTAATMSEGQERYRELVFHTFGSYLDLPPEDLEACVAFANQLLSGRADFAVAFVAQNDLTLGVCQQMSAALNQNGTGAFAVFEEEASAQEWLQSGV